MVNIRLRIPIEDDWTAILELADEALLAFLKQRGFEEKSRFRPAGYEEMVVLAKRLGAA